MASKDDPATPEPEQPGDVRGDNGSALCSHPSLCTSGWFVFSVGHPKFLTDSLSTPLPLECCVIYSPYSEAFEMHPGPSSHQHLPLLDTFRYHLPRVELETRWLKLPFPAFLTPSQAYLPI